MIYYYEEESGLLPVRECLYLYGIGGVLNFDELKFMFLEALVKLSLWGFSGDKLDPYFYWDKENCGSYF